VQALKRIFNYIKGTLDFSLWYSIGEDFTLTTYTDVDWAGSVDEKKSTSRGELFLGNILVSWLRKKQSLVSLSRVESEYIAAATCRTQVLWMKKTLQDIKVEYDKAISNIYDNTSAINISKNLVMHSKMKHIPIKYHFLREHVAEKSVKLEYIATKEQVANDFTKPLPIETFAYLRQKLVMISLSSH
jgi:hypothetical protein